MASNRAGGIPGQFDWSMFAAVREKWCGWMLGLSLSAWPLSGEKACFFVILAGVLVLIALYDWRYGLIYDQLVILLVLLSGLPLSYGQMNVLDAVTGAALGSGLLLLLRGLSQGGLGLGDVKLAAALGLWLGWENMILCLLLASCGGLVYGAILLCRRQIERRTPLPFGPFLAGGALLAFATGQVIWTYLEAFLWG
ncbi:MAG: A24 family peptidase [Selenomonas sp.]|uniref:prepilin peptidase n=1 Tax=Selenomonas sp. TaxID=2053611 RepID=UPI0025F73C9C|nr:A24 family peptidase [Selenomonas sp.]MCR5757672.1 A24 family peptidase [Selenomonas sp.]